ncbi:MAG: hypothetical protein JSW70_10390 [Syntrophobacterales bacterium]|nr:MAG: hypothetical protein JSW70_10390 [Syntrophobacterales bacterium]
MARSKLRIFGPLIYRERGIEEVEFAVRPLFYWTKNDRENFLRVEYLYPLGKFRREGGETKHYLVPLFLSRDEAWGEGRRSKDFALFPFFKGQTEMGERYWGIFPFFGQLVDRFGRDRIRFYLWPIYSDWSEEGAYTWNFLWPILSATSGGGKKGFRLWPLWGYKEEEGVSRVDFALWPFFVKGVRDLDTEDPERERIVFPLYRDVRSKRRRHVTVLWPFFSHTVDERDRLSRWEVPWPFLCFARGDKVREFRIFPFYRCKETPDSRSRWILWPLYQCEEDFFGDQREVVRRFLLINRTKTVFNRKGEEISKHVSIWPFFKYSRAEDKVSLSLLHLIPFEDEGFERNWVPLYRIYRYGRNASGKRCDILWGLYEKGDPWD